METTKPTIEQMNKVIAGFMGWKLDFADQWAHGQKSGIRPFLYSTYTLQEMRFTVSWDWLIPVYVEFRNRMGGDISFDDTSQLSMKFTIALKYGNISRCHEAVYEMIIWYNKQNP
jgi:hypothetical protein